MAVGSPRNSAASNGSGAVRPIPDTSAMASDRVGDFAFMRRVGVAMFLLGAVTLLGTLPLPDPDTSDHPAIKIIAGLLVLGGCFVWTMPTDRRRMVSLYVIYGILLVSALMAVTRPIEATPFFYLWPMLFAAYFFSRREVAVDLLIMWVTLGLALFVWSVDPMKQVLFMGVGVSVTLTTVVVTLLRERLTDAIGQLAKASATDYLTGLPNRRAFDAEFVSQIDRAQRSELPLALVLFDLDHFKQINDRFGHAAGDLALCEFAELLDRERRSGDTLARIGGEEFVVVLFGVGHDDAIAFAERIGRLLEEERMDGRPALSVSAGVVGLTDEEQTPSELLVAADQALYGAKAAGRHRVAVWEQGSIQVGNRTNGARRVAVGSG
jgi:diguanylate cyclase (GGDEF)-like protein